MKQILFFISIYLMLACVAEASLSDQNAKLIQAAANGATVLMWTSEKGNIEIVDSSCGESGSSLSSGDSGDTEMMIEELNNDIKRIRENNEMIREALKEIVMQPQTIIPNSSCSGIVVFDTSAMTDDMTGSFQVTVSLDGEEHRFTFKRSLSM